MVSVIITHLFLKLKSVDCCQQTIQIHSLNFEAMADRRVDPDDGAAYTWEEFSTYYKGKYKKKAVEEYWGECKPVKFVPRTPPLQGEEFEAFRLSL